MSAETLSAMCTGMIIGALFVAWGKQPAHVVVAAVWILACLSIWAAVRRG